MPDFNREGVWWIEAADCLIGQMLQYLGHVDPLGHDHAGLGSKKKLHVSNLSHDFFFLKHSGTKQRIFLI